MIESLQLTNFILVDQITIDFGSGLNVITGETGAGKSLVVKSLELLLGQQASEDFIRPTSESALIEAVFLVENDLGFEEIIPDNGRLIISRRIQRNRPTINKINYESVPLKKMKAVVQQLLFLTSQHQVYELMDAGNHRQLFDRSIGREYQDLQNSFQLEYDKYKQLNEMIMTQKSQSEELDNEIKDLKELIDDISFQKFSEQEEDELIRQQKQSENLQNRSEQINKGVGMISNVLELIPDIDTIVDELNQDSQYNITMDTIQLLDSFRELNVSFSKEAMDIKYLQSVDINQINERLHEIFKYKLKYGVQSLTELLLRLNQAKERLETIEKNKKDQRSLLDQFNKQEKIVHELANKLSICRTKHVPQFNQLVLNQIKQLGMENGSFSVNVSEKNQITESGKDRIEFLFSANPNVGLKSLKHIASGGELSRVMLALLVSNHHMLYQPLVVFDEIDVGIGGITANYIGDILSKISKSSQLIVITHLPQIAKCANQHYQISKTVKNNASYVTINKLKRSNVTEELQRMVGGQAVAELIK